MRRQRLVRADAYMKDGQPIRRSRVEAMDKIRPMARPFLCLFAATASGCALLPGRGDPAPLGNVIARSELIVGTNAPIRVLPDGRVFVSEEYGSQLWILDPDLQNARLIVAATR